MNDSGNCFKLWFMSFKIIVFVEHFFYWFVLYFNIVVFINRFIIFILQKPNLLPHLRQTIGGLTKFLKRFLNLSRRLLASANFLYFQFNIPIFYYKFQSFFNSIFRGFKIKIKKKRRRKSAFWNFLISLIVSICQQYFSLNICKHSIVRN